MLFSVLPLNLKVPSLKGACSFFAQNFCRSPGATVIHENKFLFKRHFLAAVDCHGISDASSSRDFSGDGGSGVHSVGGGGGSVAWN